MKVIEAHKIISDAIGDNIDINLNQTNLQQPIVIPDGVRFSRYDRDFYLYRGILSTLYKRLLALKSFLNKDILLKYAIKYFPQSLRRETFQLDLNNANLVYSDDPLRRLINPVINNRRYSIYYVFSARLRKYLKALDNNNQPQIVRVTYHPLPIRLMHQSDALLNGYIIQRPDYFIEAFTSTRQIQFANRTFNIYEQRYEVFSNGNQFEPEDRVEMLFLENPPDPNQWNPYDELYIDRYLQPEAVLKAIEFMMIDNQDLELSPAFMQNEGQIQNMLIQIQG